MPRERRASQRLLDWVRRHERRLIDAWLFGGLLLVGVAMLWGLGTYGPGRASDARAERLVESVEHGRELADTGRFEEAAAELEQLDARFPATHNRHRLVEFKEELLRQLGRCYRELGRKRRCLETLERLVEFEPNTWLNHYEHARALLHFGEPADAEEAFRAVLAIHPNNLDSVTELVRLHFDSGRFDRAVEQYEAYLDAYCAELFQVQLGEQHVGQPLLVDAEPQLMDEVLELPEGWTGEICISTSGYTVQVGRIELVGPLRVGVPAARETVELSAAEVPSWTLREMDLAGPALFVAHGSESRLCAPIRAPATGAARLRIELTMYKSVGAELWNMVEASYRNLLDRAGLEEARRRTRIGGWLGMTSVHRQPMWPWE